MVLSAYPITNQARFHSTNTLSQIGSLAEFRHWGGVYVKT
jgi:hypothetical protein